MKTLFTISIFIAIAHISFGQEFFTRSFVKNPTKSSKPSNQAKHVDLDSMSFQRKRAVPMKNMILDSTQSVSTSQLIEFSEPAQAPSQRAFIRLKNIDGSKFWKNNNLNGIGIKDSSALSRNVNMGFAQGVNGFIYTEFLSNRIGKAKISFGSVLVNAKNDTVKTVQQFLNGGGNGIIRAALPLFYYENFKKDSHGLTLTSFFMPRFSFNLPTAKDNNELREWNMDLGVEFHGFLSSFDGNLGIVGKARLAGVWGSKEFTEKIVKNIQTYTYAQLSVGLYLLNSFIVQVNVSPAISGDKVISIPSTVSIQTQF